ncbi:MAG: hemerythrin domain-containing protein [Desulforhopalus sp.]
MSEHDFLKHLRKDHNEQKKTGKKLTEAKKPEQREKLRQQFYDSLYPHMIGEEASIFQFLKNSDEEGAKEDGLESLQEHHVGKIVLRELMKINTQSPIFKAKAKVLDELNRHHIEEEEKAVFAHLCKLCDNKKLDSLFKQYEEAEEKVQS